jgi:hypothetical protein
MTEETIANDTEFGVQINQQAWSKEEPDTSPEPTTAHHTWSTVVRYAAALVIIGILLAITSATIATVTTDPPATTTPSSAPPTTTTTPTASAPATTTSAIPLTNPGGPQIWFEPANVTSVQLANFYSALDRAGVTASRTDEFDVATWACRDIPAIRRTNGTTTDDITYAEHNLVSHYVTFQDVLQIVMAAEDTLPNCF